MREIIEGAALLFGIPAVLVIAAASYHHGVDHGTKAGVAQVRGWMVEDGLGRYVFDERTGHSRFVSGHKAEHKCTVCVPE